MCADKYPMLRKIMLILVKLARCTEVKDDHPKCIRDIKLKMKEQLDSRTKDRDLAVMASMLNPLTKELNFLTVEERLDAHSMLLREAMGVSDKIQVKKEPGSEEAVLPLPALPALPALPDEMSLPDEEMEVKPTKPSGEICTSLILFCPSVILF